MKPLWREAPGESEVVVAPEVKPSPHVRAATDREGHLVAGRYRLVSRVGTGAMGVVWQGHDERLDRPVAIKKLLLRPGLSPGKSAEAVARCLREGRLAARLHHPNAITVFDVVDEDGVPNLVMEFMRSRSVATAIAEDGPLPPGEVAAIGAQVAAALAAAHAAGIVHRDITPGNVLIGEDGSAKLTDFGISRAADDVAVTKSGMVAGTPAYLAPEVAHGAEPTPASDVFSLGSTLYAAVEGEPPFGLGPNVLGVLHAAACGKINPPHRAGPLTDVLLALLTCDPAARPTAAEAHDLLAAVGSREPAPPVVVPPPDVPPPTEVIRPLAAPAAAGRPRGPLAVAGVFFVALIAVGLWLLDGRATVVPTQDRDPAGGSVHRQVPGTSVSVPVEPAAGEPVQVDQTPGSSATTPRREAPTTTTEQANPAPDTTTTPVVTTTTDEPAPTTEVPTTTPPDGSVEETTGPDPATAAAD
jgi:hypothetical protein